MAITDTRIVTGEVRLSYANIWEPKSIQGSKPKYSVSLIIPKSDQATLTAINRAIDAAIAAGTAKFGGKKPGKAALKLPLRDGDVERDDEAYAGCMFLNANSLNAPQVVDEAVAPILDRAEVYSGCYARVSMNAFPYNYKGKKGISFGLNHIQKIADGDFLGGRSRAEDDFESYETDEDDESGLI